MMKEKRETLNKKYKRLKTAFKNGNLTESEKIEWDGLELDFEAEIKGLIEKYERLKK
jgi:hypothetical protein